jgi:hypothetical protein
MKKKENSPSKKNEKKRIQFKYVPSTTTTKNQKVTDKKFNLSTYVSVCVCVYFNYNRPFQRCLFCFSKIWPVGLLCEVVLAFVVVVVVEVVGMMSVRLSYYIVFIF